MFFVFEPSFFLSIYSVDSVNATILSVIHLLYLYYFIPMLLYCISLINAFNYLFITSSRAMCLQTLLYSIDPFELSPICSHRSKFLNLLKLVTRACIEPGAV